MTTVERDGPLYAARESALARQTSRRNGPRYGILGGTFDPPHVGHLVLAQEMYSCLDLDRVWLVPAGEPPHKAGKVISPAADRLAMVRLAIADDARFAVSTIELERPGPSYSADTLELLREQWGADTELILLMGWDMLMYLPSWHAPERVVAAVDGLAAAHRAGVPVARDEIEQLEASVPGLREKLMVVPAPQLDVSATTLRERVALGLPIRYLVLDAVRGYIEERGLYTSHTSARRRVARSTGAARRASTGRPSREVR